MQTKITELFGISHPVVLPPMGWVAGGALAAAVARAGGLGIIGCGYGDPKAGYGSPDWITEQFDIAGNERFGAGLDLAQVWLREQMRHAKQNGPLGRVYR